MAAESDVTYIEAISDGVALLFSPDPFPDYQCDLTLTETALSGSTYRDDKNGLNPWLCPALFKYFPTAPAKLYGKVERVKKYL